MTYLHRFNDRPKQRPKHAVREERPRDPHEDDLCACGHRKREHSRITGICVGYRFPRTEHLPAVPCPCVGYDLLQAA